MYTIYIHPPLCFNGVSYECTYVCTYAIVLIYLDRLRSTTMICLIKQDDCTARSSEKRKRSEDIGCSTMEQSASELKPTTHSEIENLTDSDCEVHEANTKPKKMKHQ